MREYDLVTCRRENYIQAAMVQAAMSIQQTHGTRAAIAVLEAEQLPQEVIERVLTAGSRTRLSPYSALERPASLLPAEPA
jgi:guanyl-specific ribonuclease Sa